MSAWKLATASAIGGTSPCLRLTTEDFITTSLAEDDAEALVVVVRHDVDDGEDAFRDIYVPTRSADYALSDAQA